jgi:hypothetical protein
MDSASSLAFPGSRILAGWWRQLQPHHPTALWVGYLFVHRIEALVESVAARPVDPLALHVLQALAINQTGDASARLAGRLHLPPAAVHQLLRHMQGDDLVQRCEPDWCLSARGREVLQARADLMPRRERRFFPFVERLTPTGRRCAPPHYLPLAECAATPWAVDQGHCFDAQWLADTAARDSAWRERYGFPPSVRRFVVTSDAEANGIWDRVIVDRSQRVAVALIMDADRTCQAFAAEAEGWNLHAEAPVLRLSEGAADTLTDLTLAPAAWHDAWRLWCRQRHLPLSEADACRLRLHDAHLDVAASAPFVDRLRAGKSDVLREESGLLAGDGYLRAVAMLRVTSGAP